MELGKKIKDLRLKAGFTQETLAEKLGVTPQTISKYENDICAPDISLLPELAFIFGVTIDELFNTTPEQKLERLWNRLKDYDVNLSEDEFRETLYFLQEHLEAYEDKGKIYSLIAHLYTHRIKNDSIKVSKYARKAMRLRPDYAPGCMWLLTSSEHAVLSDWDTANHNKTIAFIKEQIKFFPDNRVYYCCLLNNLIADRRVKEAYEYLARFEKLFDKDEWVRMYKARIALADCRKDDALAVIDETYAMYPDDEGTVFDIAGFYGEICEYEKATEYYEKSYNLQESPKMYDALVGIARTYEITEQYGKAVEAWERVRKNLINDWNIDEGPQVEQVDREIKRIRDITR